MIFKWVKEKVVDHPGVVAGAIIGGIIGLPLGPGALGVAAAGAAIGNTLDQPAPAPKEKDEGQ